MAAAPHRLHSAIKSLFSFYRQYWALLWWPRGHRGAAFPQQPGFGADPTMQCATTAAACLQNVELAPQQHLHPQHKAQMRHRTEKQKSEGSSGLAQPGKHSAAHWQCRKGAAGEWCSLHRCRWVGKAMLFLLSAHAHGLLLFALSLCVHSNVQIGFMSPGNPKSLWASLQKERKRRRLPGDFNESYFYTHGTIKSHIMKQRLVCLFFNELYLYLTLTILIHFLWIKPPVLKSCASQLIKDSYNLIYCIIPNTNVLTGEADSL